MAEERKFITYEVRVDTSTGQIAIKGLTNGFIEQSKAVDRLEKSITKHSAATKQMGDASGLASAAVVELGRTVGDAGYGITAVTNNVQQLGTLFTTLIGRTGETGLKGVKGAFDLMGKSLWGPLGIIVAFQALTAAIEYFTRTTREAKEEFIDLEKALRDKLQVLDQLGRYAVNDADALSALKKEFRELDEFLNSVPEGEMGYQVIEEAVDRMKQLLKVRTDILVLNKAIEKNEQDTYANRQLYKKQQEDLRDLLIEEARLRATLSALKREDVVVTGEQVDSTEKFRSTMNWEYQDLSNYYDALMVKIPAVLSEEQKLEIARQKYHLAEAIRKAEQEQWDEGEAERKNKLFAAIGDGLQSLGFLMGKATQEGKAIAAAGALIDTYAAIDGILRNVSRTPAGAIPGYAIAQAAAVGLFGFAQVKKIYSVKVPKGKGGGSSGGADTSLPTPQQPSFNIVGGTQGNQIRDTIQEALGKPIRAYVTTRDIRSGEELDRNIVRGATVG